MNDAELIGTKTVLPPEFAWLADAPLFIDDPLVARLHDAIVRPLYKLGPIRSEDVQTTSLQLGKTGEVGGGFEMGSLVQLLTLGLVKPSVTAKAAAEVRHDTGTQEGQTVELLPIDTPQRQLEQLALFYWTSLPDRFKIVTDSKEESWRNPAFVLRSPRPLVLIDLPSQLEAAAGRKPQTKLIPTAAEFENGKIELIYQRLSSKKSDDQTGLEIESESLPTYPNRGGLADLRVRRAKYWAWFDQRFDATQCMLAVERAAAENGRIRWIDFRLPLTADGDTLHLHICPGSRYDTGNLAYSLIKRGFKHGIRLVGTLKSEPDMNVLAIYEK